MVVKEEYFLQTGISFFIGKLPRQRILCLYFACSSTYLQAQIGLVLPPLTCLHTHQLVKRADHLMCTQNYLRSCKRQADFHQGWIHIPLTSMIKMSFHFHSSAFPCFLSMWPSGIEVAAAGSSMCIYSLSGQISGFCERCQEEKQHRVGLSYIYTKIAVTYI